MTHLCGNVCRPTLKVIAIVCIVHLKTHYMALTQPTVVMVTELVIKLSPSFILTYRFAALEKGQTCHILIDPLH